ncbi:MAG: thermonuclease family protein [Thermohalobaculum sp.]|nr:thermonuclease family protein [Thermohalobaculum sp.]
MRPLPLALLAVLIGVFAARAEIVGPARVIDGDTIRVAGETVRLAGIDAPEQGQSCPVPGGVRACGAEARTMLERLIGNRPVICDGDGRDIYNRLLAVCTAGAFDLNAAMVASGHARAFLRYSDAYANAERTARTARRGFWAGEFPAPWDHRAAMRSTASLAQAAPGACRIKGNVSDRGRLYHLPGARSYARTRIDPDRGERWFCSEHEARAAGWRPAAGG